MLLRLLSFITKLFLLTLAVGIFLYLMQEKIPARFFYEPYKALLLFFFGVTLLLHYGFERSFAKGSKHFIRFYMLASGLKLFAFLTIIMLFAFIDKEHLPAFTMNFLFFYFIYTAFEVATSYTKFGASAKPVEKSNDASV